MHELSLCAELLRLIEAQSRRQHFHRVHAVRLEVGALAGVEIEALQFGFTVAANGTLAEGARLDILPLPGRAQCRTCGDTVEIEGYGEPCPRCGGYFLRVCGGTELRIKDLEVE